MINLKFLEDIVAYPLLKKRGEFSEVYIEESSFNNIVFENSQIKHVISGKDKGIGLRIIRDNQTYFASTNNFLREDLINLWDKIISALPSDKSFIPQPLKKYSPQTVHKISIYPQIVPIKEKIEIVKKIYTSINKLNNSQIKQITINYSDTTKDIKIANSNGVYVEEQRIYSSLSLEVVTSDNKIMQKAYEPIGGLIGFELFSQINLEKFALNVAQRALKMLQSQPIRAGSYPVVISSQAGGTMIHEAIGHSLEIDAVEKGISPVYVGRINQQVASPVITVIDDPTIPNLRGSYSFDDEGVEAQKTILVENGILKNYLSDYFYTRFKENLSTGNGRRQSYQYKPIPRMSNTYIKPGNDDPLQIINSVEKGIFVNKMGGGEVNTATGDFVFEISEGYILENGEIGNLIRGATLIGNGPDILQSITKVGNDLHFSLGMCGKDGQAVPVGDGQPTLLIPEIIVGGDGD